MLNELKFGSCPTSCQTHTHTHTTLYTIPLKILSSFSTLTLSFSTMDEEGPCSPSHTPPNMLLSDLEWVELCCRPREEGGCSLPCTELPSTGEGTPSSSTAGSGEKEVLENFRGVLSSALADRLCGDSFQLEAEKWVESPYVVPVMDSVLCTLLCRLMCERVQG